MSDIYNGFFEFAEERHRIYLRRQAGAPRPWTKDPVLHKYRFTNIYRELDRTTIHLRRTVRERYVGVPAALFMGTIVYRWFNRAEVCELIFSQPDLEDGRTPFEHFLETGRTDRMKAAILRTFPRGPWVTGAYIIKGKDGMNKLDGVLWCLAQVWLSDWRGFLHSVTNGDQGSLKAVWSWLLQHQYMGGFMAYEVVCDLRYCEVLANAPDVLTWSNAGPGAKRGLARIHGRQFVSRRRVETVSDARLLQEMMDILEASRTRWPWSSWELREVEHTLCEFDKYERARLGQGAPRGVYA